MAAKAMLTIIWPGAAGVLQPINKVSWPAGLKKILSKSRFTADKTNSTKLLLRQFEQPIAADLPLAALRFPGETAICADLCYLHPDRDFLRLFHRDLQVSDNEARQLQASLAELLDEFHGQWLTFSAKHWGLRLPALPTLQFQPIDALEGQSISDKLPAGEDQNSWRRLLNEIQMTLFDHPVNQQREADGKLPVNAVWFHGAAPLAIRSNWQTVFGNDVLLKQLAKLTQIKVLEKMDFAALNGRSLFVLPPIDTNADWQNQLQHLEQQLFKPLWQQLRYLKLNEIQLWVPEQGAYQLNRWRSWL